MNALLTPQTLFGVIFRFLGPKSDFGAQNALLGQKRLWAKKASIVVKILLGLQTSATWGRESAFLRQKSTFAYKMRFGPKMHF